PLRATNKVPGFRSRVSVLTPVKRNPRGPDTLKALATRADSQAVTRRPAPGRSPARRTAAFPSRSPGRSRAPCPPGEWCPPTAPARGHARWRAGGPPPGDVAFRPFQLPRRRESSPGPRCAGCPTWRSRCPRGSRRRRPSGLACRGRDRRPLAPAVRERHAAVLPPQPEPRGIVGVHHLEPGGGDVLHELRLGAEIVVEGLVVVEVVARQVGEEGRAEHEAVHASLIEAVG